MLIQMRDSKGKHIHTWHFTNYANKMQKIINDLWSKHENWYTCEKGCTHDALDWDCECKCHDGAKKARAIFFKKLSKSPIFKETKK